MSRYRNVKPLSKWDPSSKPEMVVMERELVILQVWTRSRRSRIAALRIRKPLDDLIEES